MDQSKIFIAGHNGMVGSAIERILRSKGYVNLITASRRDLDLLKSNDVKNFLLREKPDFIFIAAAKVGGVYANNTYRADFIYQNLMIEANIINSAHLANVQNLMFLGSSCIYPRDCPQPIKEEYLLSGLLEKTNEPYAIAKIAGIKLCESYNLQYKRNYISVMPTNLYGLKDNYDLMNSHVLPALIRKAHEAKIENKEKLIVWGSGKPKREFLFTDDLADACVFLFESKYKGSLINIGTGEDLSIFELANLISQVVGFNGKVEFDTSKPDGTPRKLLDVSRLKNLGWKYKTSLKDGIKISYNDFKEKFAT